MILRIFVYDKHRLRSYDLKEDHQPVQVSEFDYIFFELIKDTFEEEDMVTARLGDFSVPLQPEIMESDQKVRFVLGDDIDFYFPIVKTQFVDYEYQERNIRLKRLFVNQVPTNIPVVIAYDQTVIEFPGFNIKTHKMDDPDLKLMIRELLHRGIFHSMRDSLSKIYISKEDWNEKLKINRFEVFKKKLEDIHRKLPLFKQFPITALKPEETYSNSLSDASLRTIDWIVDNTHHLNKQTQFSRADRTFLMKNQYYSVDEILTEKLYNSTDTEENRIIHGFLDVLNHYFISMRNQIVESGTGQRMGFLSQQISDCIQEQEIASLHKLEARVNEIRTILHHIIPVNHKVYRFPEYSNRFMQSSHYQSVFDLMVYFYHEIDVHEHEEDAPNFVGLQSVDRLFELFCFCRLCECLARVISRKKGYFIKYEGSTLINRNEKNPHSGEYRLSFGEVDSCVSIFYEAIPSEFCYTRDLIFGSRKNRYLPDFLIRIPGESRNRYFIIDSKYKLYTKKSHIDLDFKDLIFKYMYGLRLREDPNRNIDGLMVLNYKKGITRSRFTSFFSREYEKSITEPTPIIGSFDLAVEDSNVKELERIIRRFMG
ncbi:MAG: hypothetical protein ACEPOW_07905 [Bacteroidales bacterium]